MNFGEEMNVEPKFAPQEQGDRLLEEEEAQSRRLQFVDAATLSTQVGWWGGGISSRRWTRRLPTKRTRVACASHF